MSMSVMVWFEFNAWERAWPPLAPSGICCEWVSEWHGTIINEQVNMWQQTQSNQSIELIDQINRITTNQKIDFHKTRVGLECITESDHCFKRQIFHALLGTQDDDRHHQDTKHLKVSHHQESFELWDHTHWNVELLERGVGSQHWRKCIEAFVSDWIVLVGVDCELIHICTQMWRFNSSKLEYSHSCLSHTFLDTTHWITLCGTYSNVQVQQDRVVGKSFTNGCASFRSNIVGLIIILSVSQSSSRCEHEERQWSNQPTNQPANTIIDHRSSSWIINAPRDSNWWDWDSFVTVQQCSVRHGLRFGCADCSKPQSQSSPSINEGPMNWWCAEEWIVHEGQELSAKALYCRYSLLGYQRHHRQYGWSVRVPLVTIADR